MKKIGKVPRICVIKLVSDSLTEFVFEIIIWHQLYTNYHADFNNVTHPGTYIIQCDAMEIKGYVVYVLYGKESLDYITMTFLKGLLNLNFQTCSNSLTSIHVTRLRVEIVFFPAWVVKIVYAWSTDLGDCQFITYVAIRSRNCYSPSVIDHVSTSSYLKYMWSITGLKYSLMNIVNYIYMYIQGSLNKFPNFFRMGTFIDSTHMKL